jgi:Flp pilus assembly protein TadG
MIRNFKNRVKTRNQSPTQNRTGTLTVEVALCLPILIIVLFGGYELGHANMILHSTESAAYEGARAGIVPGATVEKIEQSVEALLTSVSIKNFDVQVNPTTITETTENITVTVLVPIRENLSFPAFFMQDPTFRGECQLTREIAR